MSQNRHVAVALAVLGLAALYAVEAFNFDNWQCGTEEKSRRASLDQMLIDCPDSIVGFNECCIVHDQCYLEQRGQEICDQQLCSCMEYHASKSKTAKSCQENAFWACLSVSVIGWAPYHVAGTENATRANVSKMGSESKKATIEPKMTAEPRKTLIEILFGKGSNPEGKAKPLGDHTGALGNMNSEVYEAGELADKKAELSTTLNEPEKVLELLEPNTKPAMVSQSAGEMPLSLPKENQVLRLQDKISQPGGNVKPQGTIDEPNVKEVEVQLQNINEPHVNVVEPQKVDLPQAKDSVPKVMVSVDAELPLPKVAVETMRRGSKKAPHKPACDFHYADMKEYYDRAAQHCPLFRGTFEECCVRFAACDAVINGTRDCDVRLGDCLNEKVDADRGLVTPDCDKHIRDIHRELTVQTTHGGGGFVISVGYWIVTRVHREQPQMSVEERRQLCFRTGMIAVAVACVCALCGLVGLVMLLRARHRRSYFKLPTLGPFRKNSKI